MRDRDTDRGAEKARFVNGVLCFPPDGLTRKDRAARKRKGLLAKFRA